MKRYYHSNSFKKIHCLRAKWVMAIFLCIPLLSILQVIRIYNLKDNFNDLWEKQSFEKESIPARRGRILDRSGNILATDIFNYHVLIDVHAPNMDFTREERIIKILAQNDANKEKRMRYTINRKRDFSRSISLEKNVDQEIVKELRAIDAKGLIVKPHYSRYYSLGNLAFHTVGYINRKSEEKSEDPITGIESYYDDDLKGKSGTQYLQKSHNNNSFPYLENPLEPAIDGKDIYTTLDSRIQTLSAYALEKVAKEQQVDKGTVIVMDPTNGEILAMVNYPFIDPYNLKNNGSEVHTNYAISHMIEPGSTFKLVATLSALSYNLVDTSEVFTIPNKGKMSFYGQELRDHKFFPSLTFSEVISKSSNIGMAMVSDRIPDDIFYQYIRNLGFGARVGIDLPAESEGKIPHPLSWSPVTKPWISIGYEILVTPIQLLQAYAMVANNGIMVQPRLLNKITNQGKVIKKGETTNVRQLQEIEAIKQLQKLLENVVSEQGTGYPSMIQNIPIAGKTGTSKIWGNGKYKEEYYASFVGYLPVNNPRYAIVVVLENPKDIYGGTTSGIVFKRIVEGIASIDESLVWNSDNSNISYVSNGRYNDKKQESYRQDFNDSKTIFLRKGEEKQIASIPSFYGMSMKKAISIVAQYGYRIELIGSGRIKKQFPLPLKKMRSGGLLTLRGDYKFEN